MGYDGGGGYACEAGGNEQLGAVRYDALDEAGEGVQDAGRLARVQAEAVGNLLGYAARADYGYGVVGRAYIRYADQGRNAELGAAFAFDVSGEAVDDEVEASVGTYEFH